MIKIEDILGLVNDGLKTHYFKDITTHKLAVIIERTDDEGTILKIPSIYKGRGNYESIQDDTKGLIIYHRIIGEVINDEDLEGGFGRNSGTTETYPIRTVFYGQQPSIEDDNCEDINYFLAREFKKLFPRRFNLVDISRLTVGAINYDRETITEDEGIKTVPESVLFTIDSEIKIITTENCVTLTCE